MFLQITHTITATITSTTTSAMKDFIPHLLARMHRCNALAPAGRSIVIALMTMTVSSCIIAGPADRYVYSPAYGDGCWYGRCEGREGWHRGDGRPWEQEHHEGDHEGGSHRAEGKQRDTTRHGSDTGALHGAFGV